MNKSKVPIKWLSHLITRTRLINPKKTQNLYNQYQNLHSRINPPKFNHISAKPTFCFSQKRYFCEAINNNNDNNNNKDYNDDYSDSESDDGDYVEFSETEEEEYLEEWSTELERELHLEREAKRKAGEIVDLGEEEKEDYMGVGPLIAKIDAELAKPKTILDKLSCDLDFLDEETDSDSEIDEEEDPVLMEEERKAEELFEKLVDRHDHYLESFAKSSTLDEAFSWMNKIDKFEAKHFRLLPEYRVIAELMNRFKDSTGKEKFMLAQKLNRAIRMVEYREEFNPNDRSNYGIIQREDEDNEVKEAVDDEDEPMIESRDNDDDRDDDSDDEFDDMKERDDILLEKVNAIDKMLEEKLAALEHTFGKKGKGLEEEIRELAEERNRITEKKIRPMYRKGFDAQLIDVNRTCKVTKGGQVVKYTAIIACGNYNGVVGYAKARGPEIPVALQKAYEKCFQNLHYIDRYEDHTIAHAIQTKYKKTKIYLWPARTATGVKAGKTVETILHLAGFKNVKSKVVGSRNPHNTVKALFQALNAIETPKDVQEKFGRTVVESYLL